MKKLLFLLIAVAVVSLTVGYYLYNMPAKNLSSIRPDVRISSDLLMSSFEDDEDHANKLYLGKVVEVNGNVSEISVKDDGSTQLILESQSMMGGVSCNFESADIADFESKINLGQMLVIKGNCTGYLMDVVLERCVVVKLNE